MWGAGTGAVIRSRTTNCCLDLGLLLRPSRCLPARVVPALGSHYKLVVTPRSGVDTNLPEAAACSWIARLVSNRVLVADVVRNAPADRVYLIQIFGEKRRAAGPLRNDL